MGAVKLSCQQKKGLGKIIPLKKSVYCFPFGMMLPNRNDQGTGDYRYGFNGMEQDKEVSGNGNSYTTQFRQYDPRLGRWKSTDPVTMSWESPYSAMLNNPILFNDQNGDCPWCAVFSGLLDVAMQVVDIAMDPDKTYKDFDYISVVTSAASGLIGGGIADKVHKAYSVYKMSKKAKTALTIASDILVDTGINSVKQAVDNRGKIGDVDVGKALVDAAVGQGINRTVGKKVFEWARGNSTKIKGLDSKLNKVKKGPKGTKDRNKLKKLIGKEEVKLGKGYGVQGAVSTTTGVAGELMDGMDKLIEENVQSATSNNKDSESFSGYKVDRYSDGTLKSQGTYVGGKMMSGRVFNYDMQSGILKSISDIKDGEVTNTRKVDNVSF